MEHVRSLWRRLRHPAGYQDVPSRSALTGARAASMALAMALPLVLVLAGCSVLDGGPGPLPGRSSQDGPEGPSSPGASDTTGVAGMTAGATATAPTGETGTPAPGSSGTTRPSTVPAPSPDRSLPPIPAGAVPILYLHRVEAPPPEWATWSQAKRSAFLQYDVLPSAFAAQLDWLVQHDYTTILPRDLAAHWDQGAALPKRPVIITFDDGSHDWVTTVLPMLQARHLVAEFYLNIDRVTHGHITWDEVRTLAAAGNGIGGHDVHHVQLAGLGASRPPASSAVMWDEVSQARSIIAQEVGVAPDSMAYVGGGFDTTLESLVAKAGYTTARSILRGIVQPPARRFQLRVVRIGSRDDVLDVSTGSLVPGLPTFTARMHGVSDQK
jgi:peptidoglycan/xylan/chitin deacetylase (PgdA/CDA1 family)